MFSCQLSSKPFHQQPLSIVIVRMCERTCSISAGRGSTKYLTLLGSPNTWALLLTVLSGLVVEARTSLLLQRPCGGGGFVGGEVEQ
jgi:hypothetical protein